jgi:curved DNA-binding protein CbpA
MSSTSSTLYDILEVIPTASQETIHAAYRSLISRFHPDKMAALGSEFEAVAHARTKEINHAYDILGDVARRARYNEELRRDESPLLLPAADGENVPAVNQGAAASPGPAVKQSAAATPAAVKQAAAAPVPAVKQRAAAPRRAVKRGAAAPAADAPLGRHAAATLSAVVAGVALVLTLPQAANVIFSAVEFSLTGHARYFYEADSPADAKGGDSGTAYLMVLWGWLFANYLFGLISYRLAIAAGEMAAARTGGSFAATNDRLFLFLTFVCVVATGQLLFSAHTMGNMLAGMFILAGAYLAERGTG